MPTAKVEKARGIVASVYHAKSLSCRAYRSLLGRLHHTAMCIRPDRPFLQLLRRREFQLHRFDSVVVTPSMKDDLKWWWCILYSPRLNGVVRQYFCGLPQLDIVVETDASDYGLYALDVTSKVALTYQFTSTQQNLVTDFKASGANAFDINFRELIACVYAVHSWDDDGRLSHRLHPDHCMSTSVLTTSLPSLGRPSWNPETLGLKQFSACWVRGRPLITSVFPPLTSLTLSTLVPMQAPA